MTQRSPYDRALDLLALRRRSVAELRRKLLQKGEDATTIEEVIARLVDQRLLDDAEFARQFARSKVVAAGASRRHISAELAKKGVYRRDRPFGRDPSCGRKEVAVDVQTG
jgi:regulatory protein